MAFAFVFPGQGSQSVGMMAAYGDAAIVRSTFDEASSTLGQDLWQLVAEGPAELLAQTVNTQPLMLTAAIAAYRLWLEKGGRLPAVVAGHSLGEYSALVAAGVVDFKDAVPLVRLRATAMQEAVPVGTGAMAAILNLDDDKIREACAEAIAELASLGINSVLLSGDNTAAARHVASQVGITEVRAEVLPSEKRDEVERLQNEGKTVVMIGDGVNDAAAMAQASKRGLGMAMGSGTDVAMAVADITLVNSDLRSAPRAIRISRKTLRVIKGNLFWAFFYNLLAVPLAVLGLLNPMIAAAAMAFSSVFVVANSLRLRTAG